MAAPGQLLSGCVLPRVSDGEKVDLGELLSAPVTTLVIFGTYPADFNMIEYAQKMRHYWPQLKAKGVESGLIVVNGSPESCKRLAEILDLPAEVELLSDEAGEAGRLFGVSTGWLPDSDLNPYLKLLGMLVASAPRPLCRRSSRATSATRGERANGSSRLLRRGRRRGGGRTWHSSSMPRAR